MKLCENCGAVQSDERYYCVDCKGKLSKSLSEKETDKIASHLDKVGNNYLDKLSSLRATKADRIIGFLSLAGASAVFVQMLIYKENIENTPESLIAFILFITCSLESLFPKLLWNLEKFRLSFLINSADSAEPSDFYLTMRKIFIYIGFIIAVIAAVATAMNISGGSPVYF